MDEMYGGPFGSVGGSFSPCPCCQEYLIDSLLSNKDGSYHCEHRKSRSKTIARQRESDGSRQGGGGSVKGRKKHQPIKKERHNETSDIVLDTPLLPGINYHSQIYCQEIHKQINPVAEYQPTRPLAGGHYSSEEVAIGQSTASIEKNTASANTNDKKKKVVIIEDPLSLTMHSMIHAEDDYHHDVDADGSVVSDFGDSANVASYFKKMEKSMTSPGTTATVTTVEETILSGSYTTISSISPQKNATTCAVTGSDKATSTNSKAQQDNTSSTEDIDMSPLKPSRKLSPLIHGSLRATSFASFPPPPISIGTQHVHSIEADKNMPSSPPLKPQRKKSSEHPSITSSFDNTIHAGNTGDLSLVEPARGSNTGIIAEATHSTSTQSTTWRHSEFNDSSSSISTCSSSYYDDVADKLALPVISLANIKPSHNPPLPLVEEECDSAGEDDDVRSHDGELSLILNESEMLGANDKTDELETQRSMTSKQSLSESYVLVDSNESVRKATWEVASSQRELPFKGNNCPNCGQLKSSSSFSSKKNPVRRYSVTGGEEAFVYDLVVCTYCGETTRSMTNSPSLPRRRRVSWTVGDHSAEEEAYIEKKGNAAIMSPIPVPTKRVSLSPITSPLSSYAWLLGRGREVQQQKKEATSKGELSSNLVSNSLSPSAGTTRLSALRHKINENSKSIEELIPSSLLVAPLPRRSSTQSLPAILSEYWRQQIEKDEEEEEEKEQQRQGPKQVESSKHLMIQQTQSFQSPETQGQQGRSRRRRRRCSSALELSSLPFKETTSQSISVKKRQSNRRKRQMEDTIATHVFASKCKNLQIQF